VLIGDRNEIGNNFATSLLVTSDGASIKHMCVLKGGIDVIKVEQPDILRKGSPN